MIFQSFQWLLIFYFWKLLGQFSKFGVKGIKMIRMTKEIDLAQLVLCVSIGGPNMDFYLVLVRHVAQLHVTKQKHFTSIYCYLPSHLDLGILSAQYGFNQSKLILLNCI